MNNQSIPSNHGLSRHFTGRTLTVCTTVRGSWIMYRQPSSLQPVICQGLPWVDQVKVITVQLKVHKFRLFRGNNLGWSAFAPIMSAGAGAQQPGVLLAALTLSTRWSTSMQPQWANLNAWSCISSVDNAKPFLYTSVWASYILIRLKTRYKELLVQQLEFFLKQPDHTSRHLHN